MKNETLTIPNLSTKTTISKINKTHIAIIKNRKSRIIMKDGEKIFDQAKIIWKSFPKYKISLKTNAPVCKKTEIYLKQKNIEIIFTE